MSAPRHLITGGIYAGRECVVQYRYAGFADVLLTSDDNWVFPTFATVRACHLKPVDPCAGLEDALL